MRLNNTALAGRSLRLILQFLRETSAEADTVSSNLMRPYLHAGIETHRSLRSTVVLPGKNENSA